MSLELEDRLLDFDGNAVSILSEARSSCHDIPGYFNELFRLCIDRRPNVSIGATWILKTEADEGAGFDTELTDQLLEALDEISSWQAKLHILQSVEAFEFNANNARQFFDWATLLTDHSRPFLRAWSLHALVMVGLKFQEFRHESRRALAVAEEDSAASVRARARRLRQIITRQQQIDK